MHKIMDYFCDQLEELENKVSREGKLSRTEVEDVKLMGKAWNELHEMEMAKEEEYSNAMNGGYSRRGGYAMRGSYADGRSYMDGSYADGGYSSDGNYVRPDGSYRREIVDSSYARGRGAGAKRDSMGRYSSEGGVDEKTKEELRKLIEQM